MLATFGEWLALAPLWLIGLAIFCGLTGAALIAGGLRRYQNRKQALGESGAEAGEESVAITSVLGLLALLIAFTFAIALDRFDTRRANVLQESNAIGTTYLRAQLLEEPHRARISNLLVDYTNTRVALATVPRGSEQLALLKKSDQLIVDLWTATVAAFPSIRGYDVSNSFLSSMNEAHRHGCGAQGRTTGPCPCRGIPCATPVPIRGRRPDELCHRRKEKQVDSLCVVHAAGPDDASDRRHRSADFGWDRGIARADAAVAILPQGRASPDLRSIELSSQVDA